MTLAALLAVSQAHRRQIHEHVKHIIVPDFEHLETLIHGTWPSLLCWKIDVSGRFHQDADTWRPCWGGIEVCSLSHASDAAISFLLKGPITSITHVYLSGGFISAGGIKQLHHPNWKRMKGCCLCNVGLSSTAVKAFCSDTWPLMKRLDLSHNQLDAAAIAHLTAASWPRLTQLKLSCTGLSYEGFLQICILGSSKDSSDSSKSNISCSSNSRCWPALKDFTVSANNMWHSDLSLPAQVQGQASDLTGWTCHLKCLDLSNNSLTASAVEQLAKMEWPCLESMWLGHTSIDANAMTQICRGWPRLSTLDMCGVAVEASALQALLNASTESQFFIHLTVNLQDAAEYQFVRMLGDGRWAGQHLRRFKKDAAPSCHVCFNLRRLKAPTGCCNTRPWRRSVKLMFGLRWQLLQLMRAPVKFKQVHRKQWC